MRAGKIVAVLIGILILIFISGIILYKLVVLDSVKRTFTYDKSLKVSRELQEILYYGELAPSSHNAQMWKIKIVKDEKENKEIVIGLNKNRSLREVDPKDREGFISLGCFVENVLEASQAKGYQVKVDTDVKTAGEAFKIFMDKSAHKSEESDIIKLIEDRHTIREKFSKSVLKESDVEVLSAGNKNSITYFSLQSNQGRYIADSLIKANVKQAHDEKKQKEFSNYVRFTKKQAESKKDGVTPAGMGLEGVKRFFVSVFMNKGSVMDKSFIDGTKDTVTKQVENCGGFIVITSKDNSFSGLFEAGRVLEKSWLKAEKLKVAVHPMSQLMEENPWKQELNNKLQIEAPIQMILRVGYTDKKTKPSSERFDLKDIIQN